MTEPKKPQMFIQKPFYFNIEDGYTLQDLIDRAKEAGVKDLDGFFKTAVFNVDIIQERCDCGECRGTVDTYVTWTENVRNTNYEKEVAEWDAYVQAWNAKYSDVLKYMPTMDEYLAALDKEKDPNDH